MKALILLNGTPPSDALLSEHAGAQLVVCADGAANWALKAGVTPDILIGDMDSISEAARVQLEKSGCEIVRLPAYKNETDAHIAADIAIARGADEITLLGALGGRLDHALGNLLLLRRIAGKGICACIADDRMRCWATNTTITLAGKVGDVVSVLPAQGEGTLELAHSDGLEWPLDGLRLASDYPRGISNRFIAERATITVRSGWAVIIKTDAGGLKKENGKKT
jgi:thiamine pyrophosphokinase